MFGFLFKLIPPWFRWAALALIAAAALAWHFNETRKARNEGRAEIQAAWDEVEAERSRVAAKDSIRRTEANIGVTESYRKQIIRSQAAAVAARGELDQLRDVLADRAKAASASGRVDDSAAISGALLECSERYSALEDVGRKLAAQVTGLQRYAIEVCVSE